MQPPRENHRFVKLLVRKESNYIEISYGWKVLSRGQLNCMGHFSEDQYPLRQSIWQLLPQLKDTPGEKCLRQAMADRSYCQAEIQDTDTDQWYKIDAFPSSEGIIAFFLDITERKHKEQILRESADRFRSAIDNTPIVVFTQDRNLRYTWIYNPHPMFVDETILGKTDSELLPDESARRLKEMKQGVMDTGKRERQEVCTTIGGETFVYDLTVEPLWSSSGEIIGVTCAAFDITRQKRAEEEIRQWKEALEDRVKERTKALKELQTRFMDGVENEREKLSRELHDGVMQDIYGIAYSLAGTNPEAKPGQPFADIQQELMRINQSLRNICRDLRPPTLSKLGLAQSITEHISRYQESFLALEVRLELTQDRLAIPEKSRLALFRIFQVAFTNTIRHAQAKLLVIRLMIEDNRVILEIKDDGVGFDMPKRWNEATQTGHLGLAGAFERAESVGGQMVVLSARGKGTTVRVEVPMPTRNS